MSASFNGGTSSGWAAACKAVAFTQGGFDSHTADQQSSRPIRPPPPPFHHPRPGGRRSSRRLPEAIPFQPKPTRNQMH